MPPKRQKKKLIIPDSHELWLKEIDNVNQLKEGKYPTRDSMQLAFDTAFSSKMGNPFYTPTKPKNSYGERWFIPKGLTPQKTPGGKNYTPRRFNNPNLVKSGKVPKMVFGDNPDPFKVEAHHITQLKNSDTVFLPDAFHRGTGIKGKLHPYDSKGSKLTQKDRQKHREMAMSILEEHFKTRQIQ